MYDENEDKVEEIIKEMSRSGMLSDEDTQMIKKISETGTLNHDTTEPILAQSASTGASPNNIDNYISDALSHVKKFENDIVENVPTPEMSGLGAGRSDYKSTGINLPSPLGLMQNAEEKARDLLSIKGVTSPMEGTPEDTSIGILPFRGKGDTNQIVNVNKGPGLFHKMASKALGLDTPQAVVNVPPPSSNLGKIILGGGLGGLGYAAANTESGKSALNHWTGQAYGKAMDMAYPGSKDLMREEPVTKFGKYTLTPQKDFYSVSNELGNNREKYIYKKDDIDAAHWLTSKKMPITEMSKNKMAFEESDEVLRRSFGKSSATLDPGTFNKVEKSSYNFIDLVDTVNRYAELAGKINFESKTFLHKYDVPANYQPQELQELKALQEKVVTILGEADLTGVMTDRDIERVRTYLAGQKGESLPVVMKKVENLMDGLQNSYRILSPELKSFLDNRMYEDQAKNLLGGNGTVRNGMVYIDSRENKVLPIPVEDYLEMKKAQGAPVRMNLFPWKAGE